MHGTLPLVLIAVTFLSASPSRAEAPTPASKDSPPMLAFLQLKTKKGTERKFRWPGAEQFRETWRSDGIELVRLVRGQVQDAKDLVLELHPTDGGYWIRVASTPEEDEAYYNARNALVSPSVPWKISAADLNSATPRALFLNAGGKMIRVDATYVSPHLPIPEEVRTDWTYATTLLRSEPPIDQEFTPPMGRCSMDTRPQEAAREYAESCYEKGRLGCFLQLQVRIMGDNFARVAYSSYGEASHNTEADRLWATGLHVERFFRGLTHEFGERGTKREELYPWRLARALLEAGLRNKAQAHLAKVAADPRVDEHNRLRATETLLFMMFRASEGTKERRQAIAEVRRLDLSPLSRHRLDLFERDLEREE